MENRRRRRKRKKEKKKANTKEKVPKLLTYPRRACATITTAVVRFQAKSRIQIWRTNALKVNQNIFLFLHNILPQKYKQSTQDAQTRTA